MKYRKTILHAICTAAGVGEVKVVSHQSLEAKKATLIILSSTKLHNQNTKGVCPKELAVTLVAYLHQITVNTGVKAVHLMIMG